MNDSQHLKWHVYPSLIPKGLSIAYLVISLKKYYYIQIHKTRISIFLCITFHYIHPDIKIRKTGVRITDILMNLTRSVIKMIGFNRNPDFLMPSALQQYGIPLILTSFVNCIRIMEFFIWTAISL